LVITAGLQSFQRLLEQDRDDLCGARYRKLPDRQARRYGFNHGTVVLGGRKVRLRKPRVRDMEGREVPLPAWDAAGAEDLLEARVLEQILLGVSTRGYRESLDPLPDEVEEKGVSRSTISRRLKAQTQRQVEEYLNRSLGETDLVAIMIEGLAVADRLVVVAMGYDAQGHKHILGLVEGVTESDQVCRSLLKNLIARGLTPDRPRLFVIDGSKGLRKAIRKTFGGQALIQRCQEHKRRNVEDHLPKERRSWANRQLKAAWRTKGYAAAKKKLTRLAKSLEGNYPSAAASLREGLEETLTVIKLGLGAALAKTFRTTNPIENLNGTIRRVTRNVKRWHSGSMILRWTVTAMMVAEKSFRRVNGYKDMPTLIKALELITDKAPLNSKERVA
jgi:transposase-like protein